MQTQNLNYLKSLIGHNRPGSSKNRSWMPNSLGIPCRWGSYPRSKVLTSRSSRSQVFVSNWRVLPRRCGKWDVQAWCHPEPEIWVRYIQSAWEEKWPRLSWWSFEYDAKGALEYWSIVPPKQFVLEEKRKPRHPIVGRDEVIYWYRSMVVSLAKLKGWGSDVQLSRLQHQVKPCGRHSRLPGKDWCMVDWAPWQACWAIVYFPSDL
jgi:hypothetical protein